MQINIENVKKSRDLMQRVKNAGGKRFDMTSFFGGLGNNYPVQKWATAIPGDQLNPDPQECGTSACWAGWLVMAFAPRDMDDIGPLRFGREFLGVDPETAYHLFMRGSGYGRSSIDEVTIDDVLAMRRVLEAWRAS